MIATYKRYTWGSVVVCCAGFGLASLILAIGGPHPSGISELIVSGSKFIGALAFFAIFWFYIKSKGRSGWWILMLWLSILGIIILLALEDRSSNIVTTGES
ncbi:MAG: hypothetical protein ABII81_00405 [Pseudomonadota bacterium]